MQSGLDEQGSKGGQDAATKMSESGREACETAKGRTDRLKAASDYFGKLRSEIAAGHLVRLLPTYKLATLEIWALLPAG